MRNTARRSIVAAGIGLLMTLAFATPSSAAPTKPAPSGSQPAGAAPAGFASWADVFTVQNALNAAAIKIVAAQADGLAGVVAAPADRALQVYWKGAVPASIQKLASDLGVSVQFKPARFTQRELTTEAQRLAADPRVYSAAAKADGSGVAVTAGSERSVTQSDLQNAARIPISVTAGERPQALFSRQNDIPAFWGGSRYNSPVGGCSNGFALFVPGSANVFEISAGHCGSNGQGASIPGQASPTGTILAKSTNRDTLAINYPSGVGPAIYNGPFNSSSGVHVGGATPDFVGNLVCTGGASSGEHCGITVTSVNVFTAIGGIPGVVGPLTFAQYPTATCAVAPGDSGGPVYSYSGTDVLGRGTVTAGQTGTAVCPGVVPNGSRLVLYAPLVRPAGDPQIGSLQFYGVGILT